MTVAKIRVFIDDYSSYGNSGGWQRMWLLWWGFDDGSEWWM